MLCSYCKGKGQPARDLDSAAANGHQGDLSVVAAADAGIRKPEAGVIEDIGCVGTNLEDAFSPNMEVFAKRKLDVGKTWTIHAIPAHISKGRRIWLPFGPDPPLISCLRESELGTFGE
jgi:hypothetical protein